MNTTTPGEMTRREFLKQSPTYLGAAVVGAATLPGALVAGIMENNLMLDYVDNGPIAEGQPIEVIISDNLTVTFLPLEHSHSDLGYQFESVDLAKDTLTSLLQMPQSELWLEALPWEMEQMADFLPPEVATTIERIIPFNRRLIEYSNKVLQIAKDAKKRVGDDLEVVCPEIVGGSPLFFLAIDKPPFGGLWIAYMVAMNVLVRKGFKQASEVSLALTETNINRRTLLSLGLRSTLLGLLTPSVMMSLAHMYQIFTQRPRQNHATEDSIRECWQAFSLLEHEKVLASNDAKRHIVYISTPPHVEAILDRLRNQEELMREMKVYFAMFPDEIFEQGNRRYKYIDTTDSWTMMDSNSGIS
ncbi:MAG TPA: twin-arginine translocation signal domain-containing protein [Candidatus Woesebacteria bacterium]|nr:twin-arginine translocation signal domain-containing protein [Candidatus Woesebacteria bacterium]